MSYYRITKEGLVFTASTEERESLQESLDLGDFARAFEETFEYPLCNGLSFVLPEDIGALTSAPIFSDCAPMDDGTYPVDARFWWFSGYQVDCPVEELVRTGRVVFEEVR